MKLRTKRCGFSWSVFFRHFEHHKPSAILFQFIVEKAGISMADYVEKNMYKYVSFILWTVLLTYHNFFCQLSNSLLSFAAQQWYIQHTSGYNTKIQSHHKPQLWNDKVESLLH